MRRGSKRRKRYCDTLIKGKGNCVDNIVFEA
jgi:hypothetical protein